VVTFTSPTAARQFHHWFLSYFRDPVGEVRLQLFCRDGLSAMPISAMQQN